ncbi:MAG: T9SS type A sorting domain-containing protein [Janthinobacterium lividum]
MLCLGAARVSYAQPTTVRYIDDVFPSADIFSNILFGENQSKNYVTGVNTPVSLKLDFYQPTGDTQAQRPLIIMAFGGAFVQGQRQDLDDLCRAFAIKGYATATIDYRLLQTDPYNIAAVYVNQGFLADEIVRASSDMKAAIRFFKHDAATTNTYRIDPSKIFVAGFSAGAITALQTAYTDDIYENTTFTAAYNGNGGLEGNTDLPVPNSLLPTYNATGIAAVLSLAGGVANPRILSAGNPPLYSAQGTDDEVIPYDSGYVQNTMYKLYGSLRMQARATAVGIPNQLHSVVGGKHSSPNIEPNRSQIISEAAHFLQAIISPAAPLPVTLVSFTGQMGSNCTATLSWRTALEQNSSAYEVQASADGRTFGPVGTVPSRNQSTGATYQYRAGVLAGKQYFRLKLVDLDGTFIFSPVVVLTGTCSSTGLQAYPNPSTSQLTVSNLPAGSKVRLYSSTGQLLRQAQAGEAGAVLLLEELPAGVYLLRAVDATGQAQTLRILKQ